MLVGTMVIVTGSLANAQSVPSLNDAEFTVALKWANTNGMTKFSDEQSFKPFEMLTREQAAKFFAEFAKKELQKEADTTVSCTFSDEAEMDTTLKASVIESCQLGLFQGFQGKFDPKQPLTKAQALTVLVRAIVGKQDEAGIPRWNLYFNVAQQRGWTKETNVMAIDKFVTRYEALLLQYRARGNTDASAGTQDTGTGDIGLGSGDQLSQILQQLFGEDFQDVTGNVTTWSASTWVSGSATVTGSTSTWSNASMSGDVVLSGSVVNSGATVGSGS